MTDDDVKWYTSKYYTINQAFKIIYQVILASGLPSFDN